ncbi:AAA family ATPase [Myxococcus sp. SDU36]|uniref:AAA family ATPase n=1 Tax=Myxococcus sp. SDU36 TaxID=2831967 RepID=UPI00254329DA|nr:AAA family ATPase [Myxococcus sp. SDU36]WIG95515.1 AAA family ATPase [Myxococcus sp. SDU36]
MIKQLYIIPELATQRGLVGGSLDRLGKVVILAGPNGSGKSRYLQLIQSIVQYNQRGAATNISRSQNNASHLAFRLENTKDEERQLSIQQELSELESKIKESKQTLELHQKTIFSPPYTYAPPSTVVLDYPAANSVATDARNMSPAQLKTSAGSTITPGLTFAFAGMHAYCTHVAQSMYHARHPMMAGSNAVIQQQQDADTFNRIVQSLLGGKLDFTLDETEVLPTFRERPLVIRELSTGERILLAWAISLHRQQRALSNAIVFIDEPESHLHHDACIRALSKLRDEVLGPDGQIWLATHSVPLLAWGGLDAVHFVKDGSIRFAGNTVTSVVESLLGGKDGKDRLSTFLADADEIAFMEFAVQCILPAGVADAKTGDKQQVQFTEVLNQRLASNQHVRILDYSAGKGRFASALRERFANTTGNEALRERLNYFAYNDPRFIEPDEKDACKARVAALEQPGPIEEYYWESMAQLQATHRHEIDIIVLCNVLHEIEPDDWIRTFRDIDELLAPDGVLVVMEDLLPPVGELPNKRGYLLLDEFGLGLLFDAPKSVKVLQKRENRLLAAAIPKALLSRVTPETRSSALEHLMSFSRERVEQIRAEVSNSPSHRLGREHAHYAMLYTNASIALTSLR